VKIGGQIFSHSSQFLAFQVVEFSATLVNKLHENGWLNFKPQKICLWLKAVKNHIWYFWGLPEKAAHRVIIIFYVYDLQHPVRCRNTNTNPNPNLNPNCAVVSVDK